MIRNRKWAGWSIGDWIYKVFSHGNDRNLLCKAKKSTTIMPLWSKNNWQMINVENVLLINLSFSSLCTVGKQLSVVLGPTILVVILDMVFNQSPCDIYCLRVRSNCSFFRLFNFDTPCGDFVVYMLILYSRAVILIQLLFIPLSI